MPRIAGLALAALMVLGFAIPAAAGENSKHDGANSTLFATGAAATGNHRVLLAIDVERGTTTVIGPASPGSLASGSLALAITPDGTAAYTIAKSFNPTAAQLAKIDLATGAQTLVGSPIGADLKIMGMTFSPDGVLYAAGNFDTNSLTFNSLYTIDLSTGAPTRVGSLGTGPNGTDFIMSFAVDSHGNMYGASMMALYRIHLPRTTDAEGGATQEAGQGVQTLATKVVDFIESPVRPSAVMGIAIGEDGSFYAADYRPTSTIYAVDIETGFLKPLFPSIAFVHNIAFNPERQRGHHE
jgi:DNA-binding beta-propeller fold protein YncE